MSSDAKDCMVQTSHRQRRPNTSLANDRRRRKIKTFNFIDV